MYNWNISIRQLADFHWAIGPAREETAPGVNIELGDALADVFEEAGPSVLARERKQGLVNWQIPHLNTTKTHSFAHIPLKTFHPGNELKKSRYRVVAQNLFSESIY